MKFYHYFLTLALIAGSSLSVAKQPTREKALNAGHVKSEITENYLGRPKNTIVSYVSYCHDTLDALQASFKKVSFKKIAKKTDGNSDSAFLESLLADVSSDFHKANIESGIGYGKDGAPEYTRYPSIEVALATLTHFIEQGGDINSRNSKGQTLLMRLSINPYSPELALFLLINGADSSIRDNQGLTALDYAQEESMYPSFSKQADELVAMFIRVLKAKK